MPAGAQPPPPDRLGWLGTAVPQVRRAAGQGAELFNQVTATAAEVVRNRRDPVLVAQRRQLAARRRCSAWSVVSLALAALSTYVAVTIFSGRGGAAEVATLVLTVGLLVWSVLGAVRAAVDLRARTAVIRRLPAPQPPRYAVASVIRPEIDRLSAYSDSLRELIGMVGITADGESRSAPGSPAPGGTAAGMAAPRASARARRGSGPSPIRTLRDETLAAADEAETALRARAAELTALVKVTRASRDRRSPAAVHAGLVAEISSGVDRYGRLVAAAAQAVAATRQLAGSVPQVDTLADATDRLTALAEGMRELAGSAADRRVG